MNFIRSSAAAESHSHRLHVQPPGSPSLDSGVLSASFVPSSAGGLDDGSADEWVLFSPQVGPVEGLPAIDAVPLESSARTMRTHEADLELPAHNGDGSFLESPTPTQSSFTGDWVERINNWRLEQSHLLFSEFQHLDKPAAAAAPDASGGMHLWRRLTRRAAHSIGQYLVWDDEVLDALFSPDFTPKASSPVETPSSAPHLARAREHGPPGWENKAIRGALHDRAERENPGAFMAVLTRILLWKYQNPAAVDTAQSLNGLRYFDVFHSSDVPSMSSAPSAFWSDGWEIGTSTSLSTAAA